MYSGDSRPHTQDESPKLLYLNSNSYAVHPSSSCIELSASCDYEQDSLNANAGFLFPIDDGTAALSTGNLRHLLGSFSLTASGKSGPEQPSPFELTHCTMSKRSSPLNELAGLRVSSASYPSFTAAAAAASSMALDTGKALKLPDCRAHNTLNNSNKTALTMARHLHSQAQLQQLDELRKQFGSHQQQQQIVSQPQESSDHFLTKMSGSWQRVYKM